MVVVVVVVVVTVVVEVLVALAVNYARADVLELMLGDPPCWNEQHDK